MPHYVVKCNQCAYVFVIDTAQQFGALVCRSCKTVL